MLPHFALKLTIVVTPSAGTGCTISPSSPKTVAAGGTAIFTATANTAAGYYVGTTTGSCAGLPTLVNPATIGPVTANCTIKANCYNCNAANGTVSSYCAGKLFSPDNNPLKVKPADDAIKNR